MGGGAGQGGGRADQSCRSRRNASALLPSPATRRASLPRSPEAQTPLSLPGSSHLPGLSFPLTAIPKLDVKTSNRNSAKARHLPAPHHPSLSSPHHHVTLPKTQITPCPAPPSLGQNEKGPACPSMSPLLDPTSVSDLKSQSLPWNSFCRCCPPHRYHLVVSCLCSCDAIIISANSTSFLPPLNPLHPQRSR